MNIEKIIKNEVRKWISFDFDIFFINDRLSECYSKICLGDYEDKKKSFILLHYFKMKKDYILLQIYHNNIKKKSSNEKLLNYFESILVANGFDIKRDVSEKS